MTNNKETHAFDFPCKTAARPIYLRGWFPWKALQEVGEKVVAKEGEGEEGEEEKEDCKTNRIFRLLMHALLCLEKWKILGKFTPSSLHVHRRLQVILFFISH